MGTIVVGLDGSELSKEALRWALREAHLRGAALKVLHAWTPPVTVMPLYGLDPDPAWYNGKGERARRRIEEQLREIVADVAGSDPGVVVATEVVQGSPSHVLVDAARGADLLVVGSRGHGGFGGLLLGSVSQQALQHAACPVAIVRGAPSDGG
jgi:nucleotide-binding universal stress UspA family protein